MRDVVIDAAAISAGLWFSYIFVLLYLLIAVAGVTHRNLFFEDPVKLPFLSVDLPLVSFFVIGSLAVSDRACVCADSFRSLRR